MGYNYAISELSKISTREFLEIPRCPSEVATIRQLNAIEDKRQAWLFDLCRDLSPDKEQSIGRLWPKLIPIRTLARGGQGVVLFVCDQWRNEGVVLKVPLPIFYHDLEKLKEEKAARDHAAKQKEVQAEARSKSKILRGGEKNRVAMESLFRRLAPPNREYKRSESIDEFPGATLEEKIRILEEKKKVAQSSRYTRFERSFQFQRQMHLQARKVDPGRKLGYIPQVYEFGYDPKCYFTQEYIAGKPLWDWIMEHSDIENQDIFLRFVTFLELVLHARKIAHCDLDFANVMVTDDHCVLLDFGIAKGEGAAEITRDGAQFGRNIASPKQLANAKDRDRMVDIFALGRMWHSIITRRKPPLDVLLVEYDAMGRVIVSEDFVDTIVSLYPGDALPDAYKLVFAKTQLAGEPGGYDSINEFRTDLEGLHLTPHETRQVGCQPPCRQLSELYEILGIGGGNDTDLRDIFSKVKYGNLAYLFYKNLERKKT